MKKILCMGVLIVLLLGAGLLRADPVIVANWTFDEGIEGYANDITAFGNNCTINNASWVSGVKGNALEFNGFDSYLNCSNDSSLNFGTGDYTLNYWVKVPTEGLYGGYGITKENAYNGFGYDSGTVDPVGDPNWLGTQDGVNNYYTRDWTNISDNNWHMLTLVRNQTGTHYIDAGNSWNTALTLTANTPGIYWYKVKAKALSESYWAGASIMFTASSPGILLVGGGSSPAVPPQNATAQAAQPGAAAGSWIDEFLAPKWIIAFVFCFMAFILFIAAVKKKNKSKYRFKNRL